MSLSKRLNSSGICEGCSIKVTTNNFIECNLCHEKFHAVNCSTTKDLCSASFLQSFKKSASKISGFLFLCDKCITTNEINQVKTSDDKLCALQEQIKTLQSAVFNLADQVAAKPKIEPVEKPLTNDAAASPAKPNKTCWSSPDTPDQAECCSMSASPEHSIEKPVLIIDSFGSESETETTNLIEKTVVDNKISVKKHYKNKEGKTVIVCQTHEQKKMLKQKVSKAIPDLKMTEPMKRSKVIAIVGFSNKYDLNNIMEVILKQNETILSFFALQSCSSEGKNTLFSDLSDEQIKNLLKESQHFQLMALRQLKSQDQLSQVFLKVTPALRRTLSNLGDKLFIGMRSCVIYDRAQVVRCYNCQEYGHIKPNCPHEIQCSKCLGSHDSRDCSEMNFKCINCHKSGSKGEDHAASSPNCPQFKLELIKLQKNSH